MLSTEVGDKVQKVILKPFELLLVGFVTTVHFVVVSLYALSLI